jgi:hypothetical protein
MGPRNRRRLSEFLPLRNVREEAPFREAANALETDVRRFDDMIDGIIWRIARDAEGLPEISGGPFRVAKAQATPASDILNVLFTINSPELCSLWDVYVTPDPETLTDPDEDDDDETVT